MSVKAPSGSNVSSVVNEAATGAKPTEAKPGEALTTNPKAMAQALEDYRKLREKFRQPFTAGAAGLFTDHVVFPPDLIDPKNPSHDPKYLHLLCAVFGFKDMEKYFAAADQIKEEEEGAKEKSEEASEKPRE